MGEDPDAPIEGRTATEDFQPFFDEKTFGAGEAGEVAGARRGCGAGRGGGCARPLTAWLALQTVGCGLCSKRSRWRTERNRSCWSPTSTGASWRAGTRKRAWRPGESLTRCYHHCAAALGDFSSLRRLGSGIPRAKRRRLIQPF